jgi:hypothetical protein
MDIDMNKDMARNTDTDMDSERDMDTDRNRKKNKNRVHVQYTSTCTVNVLFSTITLTVYHFRLAGRFLLFLSASILSKSCLFGFFRFISYSFRLQNFQMCFDGNNQI